MKQEALGKKDSHLDIGFLHASPLLYHAGNKSIASPQLDFIQEAQKIKEAIIKSDQAIKFKSQVLTRENFRSMISQEPSVLHISCHGHRKTQGMF